jgi:hypothetical protein
VLCPLSYEGRGTRAGHEEYLVESLVEVSSRWSSLEEGAAFGDEMVTAKWV